MLIIDLKVIRSCFESNPCHVKSVIALQSLANTLDAALPAATFWALFTPVPALLDCNCAIA